MEQAHDEFIDGSQTIGLVAVLAGIFCAANGYAGAGAALGGFALAWCVLAWLLTLVGDVHGQ